MPGHEGFDAIDPQLEGSDALAPVDSKLEGDIQKQLKDKLGNLQLPKID